MVLLIKAVQLEEFVDSNGSFAKRDRSFDVTRHTNLVSEGTAEPYMQGLMKAVPVTKLRPMRQVRI